MKIWYRIFCNFIEPKQHEKSEESEENEELGSESEYDDEELERPDPYVGQLLFGPQNILWMTIRNLLPKIQQSQKKSKMSIYVLDKLGNFNRIYIYFRNQKLSLLQSLQMNNSEELLSAVLLQSPYLKYVFLLSLFSTLKFIV